MGADIAGTPEILRPFFTEDVGEEVFDPQECDGAVSDADKEHRPETAADQIGVEITDDFRIKAQRNIHAREDHRRRSGGRHDIYANLQKPVCTHLADGAF